MVSTGTAMADTSGGTGEWVWTSGAGMSVFAGFDVISWGTGSTFSIVGLDSEAPLIIGGATRSTRTVTNSIDITSDGTSWNAYMTGGPVENLALKSNGSNSQFDLIFFNSETNTQSSNYSWTTTGTIGSPSLFYLTNNDTGMVVSFLTMATPSAPSAVPIPSSALLLGTGVIGLLGIGSRKKKS